MRDIYRKNRVLSGEILLRMRQLYASRNNLLIKNMFSKFVFTFQSKITRAKGRIQRMRRVGQIERMFAVILLAKRLLTLGPQCEWRPPINFNCCSLKIDGKRIRTRTSEWDSVCARSADQKIKGKHEKFALLWLISLQFGTESKARVAFACAEIIECFCHCLQILVMRSSF